MDVLKSYGDYVLSHSTSGSNLAGSYVRALKYASILLQKTIPEFADLKHIWEISSIDKLEEIFRYVKREELKKEASVFAKINLPKSYWKQRFCSNAIKTFARFLMDGKRADEAASLYDVSESPETIADKISKWKINAVFDLEDDIVPQSKEGRDAIREVKVRMDQSAFRTIVLRNYDFKCCVTGLPVREVLRASHIVGWAENKKTRLLPTNGLCLSATYDAAFDKHLISFDEDYRMILAPSLKDYCTNKAFQEYFKKREGDKLIPAKKFQPSQEFLAEHRRRLK
jgi:putative restriction endonuclease